MDKRILYENIARKKGYVYVSFFPTPSEWKVYDDMKSLYPNNEFYIDEPMSWNSQFGTHLAFCLNYKGKN